MFEDKSPRDPRTVKSKSGGSAGGSSSLRFSPLTGGGKPAFVILRTTKINSFGGMSASLQHTFRERETPNADPERGKENEILIGRDSAEGVVQAWKDQAPEKVRKNAVLAIEYLVTASPEAMAQMGRADQDRYFARAVDWLKERHGPENILSAVIHRDETTPHLTAMVMPKDGRGKLNAREFLGGREKLRQMQSEFTDRVGRAHGLERGIEGSKAKHQRVQSFYGALDRPAHAPVRLPERRRGGFLGRGGETDAEYRERASVAVSEALRGIQDRGLGRALEFQRENDRIRIEAERMEYQRDAARQMAEQGARMGHDLYQLSQVLSFFEQNPSQADRATLKAVHEALEKFERSAAPPPAEISESVRERLRSVGWTEPPKERVEDRARTAPARAEPSKQIPEPEHKPTRGRSR